MKRRALLVALLLCAPHLPSFAATPPKAGAACSKIGITKIFNGKKFTCIKTGKKIVWDKGISIKKVLPIASPTPTPTPTPAPKVSQFPIPTNSQSPTSTPTPTPTVNPRPVGSDEQIKALEILKLAMTPRPMGERFRFHFSPNAETSFKDLLVRDLNRSISYWSGIYDNPDLFNVFYGTEKDLAWLSDEWRKAGFMNTQGFADELSGRLAREGQNLNSGVVPNRNDSSFFNVFRSSTKLADSGDTNFVAHETVHIVQQYLSKNRKSLMPCWVREGTADLFGHFFARELTSIDYNSLKQFTVNNYLMGSSGVELRSFNTHQWLDHLRQLETSSTGACDYSLRFAYGTGLLLSELLIADFGFEKLVSFWRSFGTAPTFRDGFKSVYTVEVEDWYTTRAIPYLIAEYRRVPK